MGRPSRACLNEYLGEIKQKAFTAFGVNAYQTSAVIPCRGDIEIRPSEIEGQGLFGSRPHKAGEVIAPAVINGEKTHAGRYANHSCSPNAKMVVHDINNIDIVAIKDIGNEEITTDYNENLRSQGVVKARAESGFDGLRQIIEQPCAYRN